MMLVCFSRYDELLRTGHNYYSQSMPIEETLETYSYFLAEIDKLSLSFITLMRYVRYLDVVIDGMHLRSLTISRELPKVLLAQGLNVPPNIMFVRPIESTSRIPSSF